MASKLDQLRAMTVIVADTGDIEAVRRLKPQDCTTNPSLLLKAVEMPAYAGLFDESMAWGRRQGGAREAVIAAMCDRLAVAFGTELAGIVPGRVSTEVDADLSFDTAATVETARAIIGAYAARGVGRERILIKLASTWEGIRAARSAAARGHRLQPHAAVLARPGGGRRRRRRVPDLALRRPHPRLARQGRRRALHGRDRSRRAVGAAHLRLLQGARHQDRGDGRLVPQRRRRSRRSPAATASPSRRPSSTSSPRAEGALPRRLSPESTAGAPERLAASTRRASASSSTRTPWRREKLVGRHPRLREGPARAARRLVARLRSDGSRAEPP